ncbi:fibronectin type III [Citricoccus zhacaiensis]|uniref:Fibronectin type III n=2 Tax=Citricoccus zhacaiensis TaxID=489142 RepID=A0ABQ2LN35_9MICC|nr:fibronectin type III [Citricoccus zhacaiensis]
MGYKRRQMKSVATPVAFSAVGALVATGAFLYPGFDTADLELHDSGIWVTHNSGGYVGHLNHESTILDGGFRPPVEDFELHQEDATALMLDPTSGALTSIDTTAMVAGDQVMLPATQDFALGAGVISVSNPAEGAVYAGTVDPSPQVSTDEPLYEAEGAVTSTTTAGGEVLVADLDQDSVIRFGAEGEQPGALVETGKDGVEGLSGMQEPQLVAVGDVPVVVDSASGTLAWPGHSVQDERLVGAVPQPSGPEAEQLALSTERDLLTVALSNGDIQAMSIVPPTDPSAGSTTPAGADGSVAATAPVRVAGCLHAASAVTGHYLQDCEGEEQDQIAPIPELTAGAELVFRVNRDVVVLNDTTSGTNWMVLDQMKVVANWDDLEPPQGEGEEKEEESDEVTQETALPERQEENRPPVAEDDSFGVRPGRTTPLPVLFNDSDPDGDVLTASLDGDQPSVGTVQEIIDGIGMQIVVPESASGRAAVTYVASDGRGGTDTARISLRVVPDSENRGPTQERKAVLRVPAGESVTSQVLTDWIDPDGDDLQLVGALAEEPDAVRTRPDGQLTFQDNTGEAGRRDIQVSVSDGRETTTGTVQIEVLERGSIHPPITQADHVTVQVGQEITFYPLENDTDPLGGQLRLAQVAAADDAEIDYSAAGGAVQWSSDVADTYYVEYLAANEYDSAPGLIRVDVVESEESSGLPVAVRDIALLPAGGQTLVNVLGNDTDPTGGVLVVQGVQDATTESGAPAPLKLAIEDFNHIRVVDTGGMTGPATFSYAVSNAQGTSQGEVTVVPLPEPEVMQPPIAVADAANVRVGDVVTIDVLGNDTHPNQEELTLVPELDRQAAEGRGIGFVSDGKVRFRAGSEPGRATLAYTVRAPDGQEASATVEITMVPMDRESNNPPVPHSVSARVLSGESVAVPIPLDGIDPDGDSVTLEGVQSPPTQGSVRMEKGRLVYTASSVATGSDVFTYSAVDRLGARATGTVTIGIAQPLSTNHPPVALDDSVEVRPGRTFTTNVLANDADPDGDQVVLVQDRFAPSQPEVPVDIVDGRVRVMTPATEGFLNIGYTIADPAGATDTANLSIRVDEEAPLMPPVARDDLVGVEEIDGREQISVSVLDNDEDPDGAVEDLELGVDEAAQSAGARVEGTNVVVPVQPAAQVIMYTLTDVDGGVGRAFILVPGNDHRAPWLTTTEPLRVVAGEDLRVDLTDHIGVRDGRTPRLTDDRSASATPASAAFTVGSATEVRFTAPADYAGGASVNVTVTDGEDGSDPNGLVSTLSIPITVEPRPDENNPPTVQSSSLQIEQGGDPVTLDLSPLASDTDGDELTFSPGQVSGEFAAELVGTELTVTPSSNAERGTTGTVAFTVSDGEAEPVPAEIAVDVVGTSRALPRALDDEVPDARSGEPVTVNVLENDINPFEGEAPLTVTAARVVTGEGTAATDGSTVTVTPGQDYSGRMQVTYTIQDLTADPARQVQGNITVIVKGRPDAPGVPRIESVDDQTVELSWAAPPDNGDPITGYTVTDTTTGSTQQCSSTACSITGLENAVEHRFTVVATNGVGESDPSGLSAPAIPDVRPEQPAPPTVDAGDGLVAVQWTPPVNRGSAITDYRVQLSPAPPGGGLRSAGAGTSLSWDGLTNGVDYQFRIQAVNQADEPSEWSGWSVAATPAGKPFAPGTPSAVRDTSAVDGGVVRLSWSAADDNGAALQGYTVTAHSGSSSESRDVAPGSTSMNWSGLDKSTAYTFSVVARNAEGTSPPSGRSAAVTPYGLPGAVSGLTTSPTGTNRQLDISFSGAASNGSPVSYEYSLGSGWASLGTSTSSTINVPANGSTYQLSVRATNDAGAGDSRTVSTQVAYGPFTMPIIRATPQVGSVKFTWSPTNTTTIGNGRSVTVTPKVDSTTVDNNGSFTTERTRAATSSTMTIQVCVTGTSTCETVTESGTSQAVPDPSVSISRGGSAASFGQCQSGEYTDCWRTDKTFSNFDPGTTIEYTCTAIGSSSTDKPGRVFTFGDYSVTVDANGNATQNNTNCIAHDGHRQIWLDLTSHGIESNRIQAPGD